MEEKTYIRKIGVMETVLRDAHQSLLATRMITPDILGIANVLDNIGFFAHSYLNLFADYIDSLMILEAISPLLAINTFLNCFIKFL